MNPLYISVGYTLVDISNTGVLAADETPRRNQCRNWETLTQVLGLRSQLMLLTSPEVMRLDLSELKFGEDFKGTHLVWIFKFGVEQEGVFGNKYSKYGGLEQDCASVPVIINLNETASLLTPTFCVSGTQKNIYFQDLIF